MFAAIRPQIEVLRKGSLYGPRHMRKHLVEYCRENYDELEKLLHDQLMSRGISLSSYIDLMENTPTPGYELTLLIIAHMFNINILVIRSDFLWVSRNVPIHKCQVVLVQNTSGEYLGTKSTCGAPVVNVGVVPKISVNKKKSPSLVQTSTPLRSSTKDNLDVTGFMSQTMSPIIPPVSSQDDGKKSDIEEGIDQGKDVGVIGNKLDEVDSNNDKKQQQVRIEDIGNESEDDRDKSKDENVSDLLLTPRSVNNNNSTVSTVNPSSVSSLLDRNRLESSVDGDKTIDPSETSNDETTTNVALHSQEVKQKISDIKGTDTTQSADISQSDPDKTVTFPEGSRDDGNNKSADSNLTQMVENSVSDPDKTETFPDGSRDNDKTLTVSDKSKFDSSTADSNSTPKTTKLNDVEVNERSQKLLKTNTVRTDKVNTEETTESEDVDGNAEIIDNETKKMKKASEIIVTEKNKRKPKQKRNTKGSKKSTIKANTSSDVNEIPDTEPITQRKRLGNTRMIVKRNKPKETTKNIEKAEEESETKEETKYYYEYDVMKLGCEKCPKVFYTEPGYNYHLHKEHRVKNVDKYPPVVLDKIHNKVEDPTKGIRIPATHKCEICTKGFFDMGNFLKHKQTCRPRTVDEEEEAAEAVYEMVVRTRLEQKQFEEKQQKAKGRKSRPRKKLFTTRKRKRTETVSTSVTKKPEKNFENKPVSAKFSKGQKNVKIEDIEDEDNDTTLTDNKDTTYEPQEISSDESEPPELAKFTPLPDILPPRKRTRGSKAKLVTSTEEEEPILEDDENDALNILARKVQSVHDKKIQRKRKQLEQSVGVSRSQIKSKKKDSESEIIDNSETPTKQNIRKGSHAKSEIIDLEKSSNKQNAKTRSQSKAEIIDKGNKQSASEHEKKKKKSSSSKEKDTSEEDEEVEEITNLRQTRSQTREIATKDSKKKSSKENKRKSEIIDNKQKSKKQKTAKSKQKKDTNDSKEETSEEDEIYFTCQICSVSYKDYDEFKKHKITCTKIAKKHKCEKCGKGYNQKTLLRQHFKFRHTNKPKDFECKICQKFFELKKTWKEHNRRLHNGGDPTYLCEICSRGFWHLGEFSLHRAGHTGVKPYKCGRCGEKAFASAERLNKHLKTCGKSNKFQCQICGDSYSTQKNLSIHVSEVHRNEISIECPLCNETAYTTKGGYYAHMRTKHNIGRKGKKLSDVMIENDVKQLKADEEFEVTFQEQVESESGTKDDQTEQSDASEKNENTNTDDEQEQKSEDDSNGKPKQNTENKKVGVKCPFSTCVSIEDFPDDEAYFQHLAEIHNLHKT